MVRRPHLRLLLILRAAPWGWVISKHDTQLPEYRVQTRSTKCKLKVPQQQLGELITATLRLSVQRHRHRRSLLNCSRKHLQVDGGALLSTQALHHMGLQ